MSRSSDYQWHSLSSFTARHSFGCVVDAFDNIYTIGGSTASGTTASNLVERYSPSTNTWTSLATISAARSSSMSVIDSNGFVYNIGGKTNSGVSGVVQKFDPGAGTWSTLTSLTTPVWGGTAIVDAADNIYVIGGWTNNAGTTATANVVRWDGSTWTDLTPMATARANGTTAYSSVNLVDGSGIIYMIGGETSANAALSSVESYDPITDAWTSLTDLTSARKHHSVVRTKDGVFLVLGGHDGTSVVATWGIYNGTPIPPFSVEYDLSFSYDTDSLPYEPTITDFDLVTERQNAAAVVTDDNRVVIIGGTNNGGTTVASAEILFAGTRVLDWEWATHALSPAISTSYGGFGAVVVIQNSLYVIGGMNTAQNGVTGRVECYGPSYISSRWDLEASLPISVFDGAIVLDSLNRVYYLGGQTTSSCTAQCFRFNPGTANWQAIAPMRTPRYGHRALMDSLGRIYVVGGIGLSGSPIGALERYNPVTNTWASLSSPMPRAYGYAALDSSDHIYFVGGNTTALPVGSTIAEKYTPGSDTWNTLPPMTDSRFDVRNNIFFSSSGALYVFGGGLPGVVGSTLSSVERYSPSINAWNLEAAIPGGPRSVHAMAKDASGRFVLAGGYTDIVDPVAAGAANAKACSEVYRFDPNTASWSTLSPMTRPRGGHGLVIDSAGDYHIVGGNTNAYYLNWPAYNIETYTAASDTWSEQTVSTNYYYNIPGNNFVIDSADRLILISGTDVNGLYSEASLNNVNVFERYGTAYSTDSITPAGLMCTVVIPTPSISTGIGIVGSAINCRVVMDTPTIVITPFTSSRKASVFF